jgi:hypothetical protein
MRHGQAAFNAILRCGVRAGADASATSEQSQIYMVDAVIGAHLSALKKLESRGRLRPVLDDPFPGGQSVCAYGIRLKPR